MSSSHQHHAPSSAHLITARWHRHRHIHPGVWLAGISALVSIAGAGTAAQRTGLLTLAGAGSPASLQFPRDDGASARRVVEYTITASPTVLSLIPGKRTETFAYNGQVPGPTLELREGDSVVVHFR